MLLQDTIRGQTKCNYADVKPPDLL